MKTQRMTKADLGKQQGFSLTELMLVLVVIALLIGGIFGLMKIVKSDQEITQLKSAVLTVNAKVMGFAAGAGQYGTGNLNNVLIQANQVPDFFVVSGTTITHPVGGTNGQLIVEGRGPLYAITVTGLKREDCINFLTGLNGFKRVFVDTSSTAPANVSTGGTVPPISKITATSLCTAATGNAVHLVN